MLFSITLIEVKRKYFFHKQFRFATFTDLLVFVSLKHDLTIFGKFLSVSICQPWEKVEFESRCTECYETLYSFASNLNWCLSTFRGN